MAVSLTLSWISIEKFTINGFRLSRTRTEHMASRFSETRNEAKMIYKIDSQEIISGVLCCLAKDGR